jgi:hypothetical protein
MPTLDDKVSEALARLGIRPRRSPRPDDDDDEEILNVDGIPSKTIPVLKTTWGTFYQRFDEDGDPEGDELWCVAKDGRVFTGYQAEESFGEAIANDDFTWIHKFHEPYIEEIKQEWHGDEDGEDVDPF